MTRSRALLAPLALLALAGCGGPLLSAEVVIDRFCFTQHVTGLPPIPLAGTASTPPVSVPLQLPPLLRTKGSTAVVQFEDGRITATTAGVTLDGITGLVLLVQPGAGGPVALAHYAKPAGAAAVTSLPLAGDGTDVIPLAQSGNLQVSFTVTASGPPPASSWDADLELCFHGKTVVSYF